MTSQNGVVLFRPIKNKYRAQNEAYKIEKTKKWEKSMNDRELER